MLQMGGVILFLFVILVMATLGAVLLSRFWLANASLSTRVIAASVGGPLIVFLPLLFVMADEGLGAVLPGLLGISVLVAILALIIGWPVAYFATKTLDKLTRFNVETFE